MMEMSERNMLFEPGTIGKLRLKNRIVLAPMIVGYGDGFYTTEQYNAFLEAMANGGVGLVITGAARVVSEKGILGGSLGIFDDRFVPSLAEMVKRVKLFGTKIFMQVNHAGTRASERSSTVVPIAPSPVAHPLTGVTPREMTKEDIGRMVESFASAARRIKEAGFDGVEIHGAHGYLLNQFLSPRTNVRQDEYGGTALNRARFACEVISEIRKRTGPDFPVSFRICGDEYVEGGVKLGDAVEYAKMFVDSGVDALHVSAGCGEAHNLTIPNFMHSPGCLAHLAAGIKDRLKVPVIAVGKLGDPDVAERILREGKADFIAMGRPLLADHNLPKKAKEGRLDEIRPCISCNLGCSHLKKDGKVTCTVNPTCGMESDYKCKPAPVRKRVAVIGGGLAGMEAARNLAVRKHEVFLYEKEKTLGGQWNIVAAYRPEVGKLTRFLERAMRKENVRVNLECAATPEIVKNLSPDAVVLATGARPVLPDIPGIERENVVLAMDVLLEASDVGEEILVIGGGLVGCDVAVFLAKRGKSVRVVDKVNIVSTVGRTFKLDLMQEFLKWRVETYQNCEIYNISERGANIVRNGELLFLEADTVVIAAGSRAEDLLGNQLKGFVPLVRKIGDCVTPRNSLSAIHEGFQVAMEL